MGNLCACTCEPERSEIEHQTEATITPRVINHRQIYKKKTSRSLSTHDSVASTAATSPGSTATNKTTSKALKKALVPKLKNPERGQKVFDEVREADKGTTTTQQPSGQTTRFSEGVDVRAVAAPVKGFDGDSIIGVSDKKPNLFFNRTDKIGGNRRQQASSRVASAIFEASKFGTSRPLLTPKPLTDTEIALLVSIASRPIDALMSFQRSLLCDLFLKLDVEKKNELSLDDLPAIQSFLSQSTTLAHREDSLLSVLATYFDEDLKMRCNNFVLLGEETTVDDNSILNLLETLPDDTVNGSTISQAESTELLLALASDILSTVKVRLLEDFELRLLVEAVLTSGELVRPYPYDEFLEIAAKLSLLIRISIIQAWLMDE